MGIEWEGRDDLEEMMRQAAEILGEAGVDDEYIGKRLDIAGDVLLKHRVMPYIVPSVLNMPGEFVGVTYRLPVATDASEAFEMNMELAQAELDAGLAEGMPFEVVFEAAGEE